MPAQRKEKCREEFNENMKWKRNVKKTITA